MTRIITGIQPTGTGVPHLGNYLGVLKNLNSKLNDNSYVFVADVHSTTVPFKGAELRTAIRNTTAFMIASGVEPKYIFQQSQVSEHFLFNTILTHITPIGYLERMTQFKSKSEDQKSVLTGLLTYPVLMAADILLYDVTHVPVGEDQTQHVQLTRDIADFFNKKIENILTQPEALICNDSKRVMSLFDGTKKMSKSDENKNGIIFLDEDISSVKKKIMKATTDSYYGINPEDITPSVQNLLNISSSISGIDKDAIISEYQNKGYGVFKKFIVEQYQENIIPIKNEFDKLISDTKYIDEVLFNGSYRAKEYASIKMNEIKNAVGF